MESLDLTGWDTSNIKSFDNMFGGCENLKMIKGFDKLNVPIDVLLDIKQCCPNIILKSGEVKNRKTY